MRYLFTILLLLPLGLNAQENKVSFSTFFTPSFAYRYTTVDYEYAKVIKHHRDSIDHHMFGYQAGQLVHIKLSKRFSFATGVSFSDMGHLQRHNYIITNSSDDTITNAKLDLFYHRTYLDIPLMFDYKFSISRMSYYTSLGIEANFSLNEYALSLLDGKQHAIRVYNNSILPAVNYSARLGVGCDYMLTSTTSIYGLAIAKAQLKPILTNAVNEYDYLAGVMLGIKYQLK